MNENNMNQNSFPAQAFQSLDPREFPIICNYCENLTAKMYVTNPAIARDEEIKKQ